MKAPVWPTQELLPSSELADTTLGVTSHWLAAGASTMLLTKVLTGTPLAAGQ